MENEMNIAVFEGTGRIGRELLKLLSEARIPTIAVTRNKKKTESMPFIEWVELDFSDREGLAGIMRRANTVFLSLELKDNWIEEQISIVELADANGVINLIKLCASVPDHSPCYLVKALKEAEERLKTSEMKWTILQLTGLMQFWLGDFSLSVKKERRIYRCTGNGRRAYIDARDVAEVAFQAIINPEKHAFKNYFLTGPRALNYAEIAEAISFLLKRDVVFISLTPEQAKKRMEEKGMPELAVNTILAITEEQREGEAAFTNNNVEEILQKPARSVEVFLADHAEWFR